MKTLPTRVTPALKALLEGFIDYAGCFPPASVPLDTAVKNYKDYSTCEFFWMLHWLVISANSLNDVPEALNGKISLLAESDNERAAALETRGIVQAARPVYCEVAVNNLEQLAAVQNAGCFAKIRMGGVTADAIPAPDAVAAFILECARLRLPFKATAGLHHPIRATQPLTYEENAPKAVMHGFLNVLTAAAFAWHGDHNIEEILTETDASAFKFDELAHYKDRSLTAQQVRAARKEFIHSIGSCSFDEPLADLEALELI
ncbi:MAG TPA: hypothetical protein V6C72_13530 [Chroococcales cyanobacterium]